MVEAGEGGGFGWGVWEVWGEKCRQLYLKNNKIIEKLKKKESIRTECATKFENLYEVDKFLEKYNLLKLNEKKSERLNRPINAGEV